MKSSGMTGGSARHGWWLGDIADRTRITRAAVALVRPGQARMVFAHKAGVLADRAGLGIEHHIRDDRTCGLASPLAA